MVKTVIKMNTDVNGFSNRFKSKMFWSLVFPALICLLNISVHGMDKKMCTKLPFQYLQTN